MERKTPPFGMPLQKLLKLNLVPNNDVYLFIGKNSWKKGNHFSKLNPTRTIILPPDDLPHKYDWPVKGCDVLIFGTSPISPDTIEGLILCLFASDANICRFISCDYKLNIFKKDF